MEAVKQAPWSPYEPSATDPWDLRKVAHLHRRAGFGATLAELNRDHKAGPAASVERLLSARVSSEESEAAEAVARTASSTGDIDILKAGWLARMLWGTNPLQEKLTLFWHGFFATSNKKVDSASLMGKQNATLRSLALGGFGEILNRILADPAMLVWLDGAESVKARPNENLAREFLELYTLGPGHFSETDIRETARAFAGWKLGGYQGQFGTRPVERDPSQVDDSEKTVLGRKGPWKPVDIVGIVLDRPEAADFLARKLYRGFVSESVEPTAELIAPLAEEMRRSRFSIKHVVGVILRSNHFYSRDSYRQRIKSPVEASVGVIRVLEVPRQALNPLALAAACGAQGQDLFFPPNVNGWAGGKSWIDGGAILQRGNWIADVVWGQPEIGLAPFEPLDWGARQHLNPDQIVGAFLDLLLQDNLAPNARKLILEQAGDVSADGLRKTLQLILNRAEFQLA